ASIIFGIVWTIAFGVGRKSVEADEAKERATRAEREREERARVAVADERARIARELHDVVGHSVSVMTVQASAVRRLLRTDQQREREALLVVERTGREALAEMRRMVGVLRRPEEGPALAPQPSLEHVERLVEQAREAGLSVELQVEGDPPSTAASSKRVRGRRGAIGCGRSSRWSRHESRRPHRGRPGPRPRGLPHDPRGRRGYGGRRRGRGRAGGGHGGTALATRRRP